MNLIKSIFIFIVPVLLILVCYLAIKGLMVSDGGLIYVGLLLSSLPLLLFLSYIMLFRNLARTSLHLLSVSLPSLVGYIVTLSVFIMSREISDISILILAMGSFLSTLLYVYWYSNNSRKKSSTLQIGRKLPVFSVVDVDGNSISSDKLIKQSTLMFFYRGNWCPLCMAQIDEVAQAYQKFADLDIDVIFISPQSSVNTRKLAHKYNLNFQFYSDKGNLAAKQLGIEHAFGLPMGFQALGYDSNSVYPTIIALDDIGKIIYCDQTSNYRLRPEPDVLLAVFS